MRLFQNAGLYRAYVPRLRELTRRATTFDEHVRIFMADRYGACHHLQPVLLQDPSAFFTNADDDDLQARWAAEHGLPSSAKRDAILLAQIEAHRAEVFYNMDPMRFPSDFLKRLPGCVRHTVAWRAAPSPGLELGGYDRVVCNFPSILARYTAAGLKAAFLSPAHDPVMDTYAARRERPIDVLFVGGYSRHHERRARVLDAVAALSPRHEIRFCVDRSRLTRLAESPLGRWLGLARHARPATIRAVSHSPVFGRALYALISQAKIVLNGAVDMAGADRGNMRCFEAMGCGALMVSDRGHYPHGMVDTENMMLYDDGPSAARVVAQALADPATSAAIAERGFRTMQARYGKSAQWQAFVDLVADIPGAR